MPIAYPSALDTANALQVAVNSWRTSLVAETSAVNIDLIVASATGLQSTDGVVGIDNELIQYEFIDAGGANPVLRNCTRGFDGTSAALHRAGAYVEVRWAAYHHNQLSAAIRAVQGTLGTDPQGSAATVAQRLLDGLPLNIEITPATTDWSFSHSRGRLVGVQAYRKVGSLYELVTPASLTQELVPEGVAQVAVTLSSAEEGYLVVL